MIANKLKDALVTLGVAEEQLASARKTLAKVEKKYSDQMDEINAQWKADPDVLTAKENLDELLSIYSQAYDDAKSTAVKTWQSGLVGDKKTWQQDGFTMQVRELRDIVVTDYDEALSHLKQMNTIKNVVKSVKVTLHKAKALALHDLIGIGINGTEVREKTTCSISKT